MKTSHYNRRDFLKTAGIGSLGMFGGIGMLPQETLSAIEDLEPMKITGIDVVRYQSMSWDTIVRLYTDTGLVGIGEAYVLPESQVGALKDLSTYIMGKDPRDIERLWRDLYERINYYVPGGAEMRILSAVNIAQWDILGKACGLPVYSLLGGKAQQRLRVYNTYVDDWSHIQGWRMHTDTENIVNFLLDIGVKGIKILPYDFIASQNNGSYISPAQVEECLDWIKRINDAAGNDMDIGIEFHSKWNLPCALRIAESLEPYNIMFLEDMLMPDNMQSYAVLARETKCPIAISERLATRYQFREMLESKAVDVVMYDVTWCGGLSEAKKISDMADTYYIPSSPHTAAGPIVWVASVHLATALTNFYMIESSHLFYTYRYPTYITNVPTPVDGFVTAPDGPGLGIELSNTPFENGDASVEVIAGSDDSTSRSVEDDKPVMSELTGNYPNPFNNSTTISYKIAKAENVKVSIFNLLGQEIAVLENEVKYPGTYSVTWNARGCASGTYICRIEAGSNVMSRKMTLVK